MPGDRGTPRVGCPTHLAGHPVREASRARCPAALCAGKQAQAPGEAAAQDAGDSGLPSFGQADRLCPARIRVLPGLRARFVKAANVQIPSQCIAPLASAEELLPIIAFEQDCTSQLEVSTAGAMVTAGIVFYVCLHPGTPSPWKRS